MHFITLLLAIFCGTVMGGEPSSHVDTFSKLRQGDTLIVRFHTMGCFHDATHEFTFSQAAELTVSVAQLPRHMGGPGENPKQTHRVDLGTLTLSKSDIAGLDKLMDFYRSKAGGGCTTVDDITFTQQRNGKTVATEQIRDDSCQTYEMKDLTRLPDLIGRVSPQKK